MIVIRNGIDINRFKPDDETGRRVRWEWGIKEGEKLVGLVGCLDPMKDHPTFLKAAALVAEQRKDVRFVCVGDGPNGYREELYSLANELGLGNRLIWAGSREDMPAVYNALDLAVSSSWGEGFSNVVAEAMSCGVPCVITDVGDSAYIVGKTGQLISPCNLQALVKGIEIALRDGSEDKTEVLRQRIPQNFAVQVMVQATEKSLKETAGIS